MESQSYIAPGLLFSNEKLGVKFAIPFGLNDNSADRVIHLSLTHTF